MPRPWVKFYRQSADSDNLTKMLEEYPLADALYHRALSRCGPYGRLPGTPDTFKATVIPWANIALKRVEKALAVMEKYKLIRYYQVGAGIYIEIVNWFKFQDFNWQFMSRPVYPTPPNWEPPQELLAFLTERGDKRQVTPERYGLATIDGTIDATTVKPKLSRKKKTKTVTKHTHHEDIIVVTSKHPNQNKGLKAHNDGRVGSTIVATTVPTKTPTKSEREVRSEKLRDDKHKTAGADTSASSQKLNKYQQVILKAWQAFGFTGQPSVEKTGNAPGYSGLVKLIQQHGIPMVNKWIETIAQVPLELPEGAERWAWFKEQFRAAISRPWEWQQAKQQRLGSTPARKDAEYPEGEFRL